MCVNQVLARRAAYNNESDILFRFQRFSDWLNEVFLHNVDIKNGATEED